MFSFFDREDIKCEGEYEKKIWLNEEISEAYTENRMDQSEEPTLNDQAARLFYLMTGKEESNSECGKSTHV